MAHSTSGTTPLQRVKVLNNNVVLAQDHRGREVILVGRGLGFHREKTWIRPDDPRVEKVFVLAGERQGLLQSPQVDTALVAACAEVLGLAARRLGRDLSDAIYEGLLDHLAMALQRARLGLDLPNPFLAEIQLLYPEEYQVAGEALEILSERLGTPLPEAERGFLALHLAAGRSGNRPGEMARRVAVVQEAVAEIKAALHPQREPRHPPEVAARARAADAGEAGECPRTDAWERALSRLAIHLHHTLMDAAAGQPVENPLLDEIQSRFPDAFALARAVCDQMSLRTGHPISDAAAGYLAMHILRLRALQGHPAG
ncbi:MAG: PRD domain-containing protein [Firmicutes bacterium]|nr:PRD domain-containing protein [Bacillota bacterium]